jgi:NAD+ kinase
MAAGAAPRVGLLTNEMKPIAQVAAHQLSERLARRGIATASRPIGGEAADDEADFTPCDFVVVFGGDGTLLSAARRIAPLGIPLLGVHLGHFGFLAEVAIDDLGTAIERILDGDATIQERLMVQGTITRDGAPDDGTETLLGMNDFVVASRAVRMVHIRTEIGGEPLATYAADGVIVASPTGSTGYSLSAGGPLVHPGAPVLIVTPIAPHTLSARALVIPDTETVTLTVDSESRDSVVATVDGQIERPLRAGDRVQVRRAPFPVRLLGVGGSSFTAKIRERWHYGERISGPR